MALRYANGLQIHVQVLEADTAPTRHPPVVMIHNLLTENMSSYFYTLANPVALTNDVLLYDLRGHGRSDMPPSSYTLTDHVADLAGILDHPGPDGRPDGRPAHLVGHGYGGAIALSYALEHPERVASLVLIDAHFGLEGWDDDSWHEHLATDLALAALGWSEPGLRGWVDRYGSRKLDRLTRHTHHLLNETTLASDLDREPRLPAAALDALSAPVLAFYSEGAATFDRTLLLDKHVPHYDLHVLPEPGQSALFDATDYVRDELLSWLNRPRHFPRRR